MGSVGIQSLLMQYFEKRPGVNVYLEELQRELGEDLLIVQTGVRNLRQREDWMENLQVVVRGRVWLYEPGRASKDGSGSGQPLCFEQVGKTKEGDLVLQCEDGRLFRAHEL